VSPQGTAAYDNRTGLPLLVERAVGLARRLGFANSCRPEHGRLLHALAAGAGTIGETGTGCGVGLAWLASGARPGARLVSVEIDTERAGLVASLFADLPQLAVLPGDWRELYRAAPFDLLVLDGGGYPPDPEELLKPGGTVVIDDLTRPRPGHRASKGRSTRPGCTGSPTRPWTQPNSGWPPTWPPSSPPAASLLVR
jgi:predicted O-methyltransferase YrrM